MIETTSLGILRLLLSSTFAYGSTCVLEASDPRHHIHAIHNLATDSQELGMTSDYSKSNVEMYSDLACAFIKNQHLICPYWGR